MATPRVKTLSDLIERHNAIDSALDILLHYGDCAPDIRAILEIEKRKAAESISRQYDFRYFHLAADKRPILLSGGRAYVPVTAPSPSARQARDCLGLARFDVVNPSDLPII